jgi:hypothetical protein
MTNAEPHEVSAMHAVGAQKEQHDEVGEQKYGHVRPFSNIRGQIELSLECNSLHADVPAKKPM